MYLAPTADPPRSPMLRARVDVYECRGGKRSKVSPRGALNLPAARFLQTKRFDPLPKKLSPEIVPNLHIAAPLARAGRHAMLSAHDVSGRADNGPVQAQVRTPSPPVRSSLPNLQIRHTMKKAPEGGRSCQPRKPANSLQSPLSSPAAKQMLGMIAKVCAVHSAVQKNGSPP
jgi:hypothetical protein